MRVSSLRNRGRGAGASASRGAGTSGVRPGARSPGPGLAGSRGAYRQMDRGPGLDRVAAQAVGHGGGVVLGVERAEARDRRTPGRAGTPSGSRDSAGSRGRVWSVMRSSTSGARRGATSRRGRSTARRIFPATMARPEVAPSSSGGGCRGFVGPVPPPLWMRRRMKVVVLSLPWHAAWLQHRRGIIPLGGRHRRADDRHGHVGVVRQPDLPPQPVRAPAKLRAAKERQGLTVSVCLPTRDEAATVGGIVRNLRRNLVERARLVDEIVVMDAGSADDTAAIAQAEGAAVFLEHDVLPAQGPGRARARPSGRACTSVRATSSAGSTPTSATSTPVRLRAARPAAHDPEIKYVKAFYERPIRERNALRATGGAGSPSCWPARSSTCSGRSWPASCSRCRASTPGAARPSSRCRSSPATGSSWACWSTSRPASGSTPSPRSTWTGASTGTRTCRRSAG